MNVEAEVIRFCNPKLDGGTTLFVAGFPSEITREKKWHILQEAFTQFGIIHEIQFPSSESQPFAFASFYSSQSAARAKAALNQVLRVNNRPLKVQFAHESSDIKLEKRLPFTKCCELANYYLGFNGWNISSVSNSCTVRESDVSCHCAVRLTVKGSEDLEFNGQTEKVIEYPQNIDQTGRLRTIGLARKLAYQQACEKSFSKLVLVTLPNGKIAVQKLSDD